MNCIHHTDQDIQGICELCGHPFCQECLVDLGGQPYCKRCLSARVHPSPRKAVGLVRSVLSAIPGLGHLYLGLMQRGVQVMATTAVGAALLNIMLPRSPIPVFFVFGMIFFSIFDAREMDLRRVRGEETADRGLFDLPALRQRVNPRHAAYGLIAFGALILYNALLHDLLVLLFPGNPLYWRMMDAIRSLTVGALLFGLGVWLLRRNTATPSQ